MSPAAVEKTHQQYVAIKKGGPFQIIEVPYPIPGPDEICIRNRAVALNAIDLKGLHLGMMVKSFPEIFGIDTAGVVEVVGSNVTSLKAGDAVMASCGLGGRKGAFQDVTTIPAHFASRKPSSWTFAEACSAPISYLTASSAISHGLLTPLPHLAPRKQPTHHQIESSAELLAPRLHQQASIGGLGLAFANPPPPPYLSSVLISGGSSSVGASAIQLLRMALPDVVIISANSPAHNKHVLSLGANTCVDRNLKGEALVSAIRTATPNGKGVSAILDAVGAAEQEPCIFEALDQEGAKMYTNVYTGREVEVPNGVEGRKVFAHMMFTTPEAMQGGMCAMSRLVDIVEEGRYKLSVEVDVVGKGLESIAGGLEMLRRGVSGRKLVVAL